MLGTYFYHEIIKKTVIGFGTLFNNIHVRPMQKFLARLQQQPELNNPTQIVLPRMSFEMVSIQYDPGRKTGVTQSFKAVDSSDGDKLKKVYLPVPYNIGFELNVLTKLNDDSLQILEQILPFFQPAFNVTVDLIDSIGEKKDIPIVLDSISFQDDYEGDFSTRRVLIYTLRFTAKTYLFGPISSSSEGLIRKVQVDYYTSTDVNTAKREVRYTATPDPINAEPEDDFGFSETVEDFTDSRSYSPSRGEDI
jgi:hypothetical protein